MKNKNKWRLPTKDELAELYRSGNLNNISNDLWSSITCASSTSSAWIVDFSSGLQGYSYKANSNYVFCVRTKKNGKLKCQKNPSLSRMNWNQAMNYADNLNKQKDIK